MADDRRSHDERDHREATESGGVEKLRPARRRRAVKGTVAKLRLDAVASLGFGVSRTAMADEIRRGRVAVNRVRRLDPSFTVRPSDVISLEGRGDVTLASVEGETRKGRIKVRLEREVDSGL